ncbi:MAG: hypothetical protein QXU98_05100 [Candidatus Parvarchaeota archaeon]
MEEDVTTDLSEFGYRELDEAVKLLTAYKEQGADFLGTGVHLCFNRQSGNVFLSDEDFNTAMMNGDRLEQWYACPECGYDGFKEDIKHEGNERCKEFLKSIGVE